MLISRKRYELICEIVVDQDKKIKRLEEEKRRLKRDLNDLQNFCMNYAADHTDIDFPNSKKGGFEDSNIFTL